MRATACALEQALAPSAASAVKQSVLLARRRGHSQVTPLHVANTLLAAPEGSFRSACLRSHSHPLQCKALELCFNVALNRLPTTLAPHHTPAISNALVAAFKRGQAHGRRGSVEAHLLAAKIDLDQLVISILDDPSVSRVMKEAGFSSTQVKTNLESESEKPIPVSVSVSPNKTSNTTIKNDVSIVIEALLVGRKRRSLALVGECVSSLENIVKGLMDKVDKGEVPAELREIKLVTIPPLYTFCNLGREEVERKVSELTSLVKSVLGRGVVLYLGDFKWISDYRVCLEKEERRYYCSVEHAIMEIGKLVWGIGETEKFWLMGIATFPTYLKCKNSSLENVWGLHPVTIPANNVVLWQRFRHDETGERNGELNLNLSCCFDCSAKFDEEARDLPRNLGPTLSELPSWLKEESRRLNNQNQTSEAAIKKACMKWNSFCSSAHKHYAPLDKTPTESTNFFSFNQHWTRHIEGNAFSSTTTSSSEATEIGYAQKLTEFSAENLNILCNGLEKKFPCHKEIIPEIAGTILQCRSGMLKRKDPKLGNTSNTSKQETWMSFVGPDPPQAKEKISKELAKVVFGSHANFLSIGLSSAFAVSPKPSNADCRNKRVRDEENSKSYLERLCEAVSENPHRVFFLEDLEQVDHCSRVGIRRAIEEGKIRNGDGDEFGFCDAVVVLSYESLKLKSSSRGECDMREEGKSVCALLDLNVSFEGFEDEVDDEFGFFEDVDRRVVFRVYDL